MSFWGMSKAGKDARGSSREIDRWMMDRGKNAYRRADKQYGKGDTLSDILQQEYGDLAKDPNAFGTPEELTETGGRIMPWVDRMVGDRGGRTEGTLSTRAGLLDEMGGRIEDYGRQNETDITDLAKRLSTRDAGYHDDILDNTMSTYGRAKDNSSTEFGNLRRANSGLFGDLTSEAGSTFDKAINMVRPGSEARAATAARAFAPQVSRVMQRLRAAGIDPRTPEGQSLLANVEGQRSRAMDDQLGDAISQTAGLTLDKFNTQSNLRREGAENDRDMAIKALLNDQGLSIDLLNSMTSEKLRSLAAQQGIDEDMVLRKMTNRGDVHRQKQDLSGARMDEASYGRDLRNEDDLFEHDIKMQRYGAGSDLRGKNFDAQETGRSGLGQVMQTAYNQGNTQDQYGNQSMGQAKAGFDQTHQQEAANAGWGKKMLGGFAKAGINYFAPGAAKFLPWGNNQQAQPQQQQQSWTTYRPPKVDTSAASWGRSWVKN